MKFFLRCIVQEWYYLYSKYYCKDYFMYKISSTLRDKPHTCRSAVHFLKMVFPTKQNFELKKKKNPDQWIYWLKRRKSLTLRVKANKHVHIVTQSQIVCIQLPKLLQIPRRTSTLQRLRGMFDRWYWYCHHHHHHHHCRIIFSSSSTIIIGCFYTSLEFSMYVNL